MNKKMTGRNCLNMQYEVLEGLFFDNKEETDSYLLCTSRIIDDYYFNLAYIKNKIDIELIQILENQFKEINRTPSIYLSRDDINFSENKQILLNNGYRLNNIDVYMEFEKNIKIDINTDIRIVKNEKDYNDFMKVLSSAHNDKIENDEESLYSGVITENYYKAIKNSINSKKHFHFIEYDNNIPVCVSTLNIKEKIGIINDFGTAQGYWNMGFGKQLMAYMINKFYEMGGKILTLSTEYKSKNQLFYEKVGFKEKYIMEQFIK